MDYPFCHPYYSQYKELFAHSQNQSSSYSRTHIFADFNNFANYNSGIASNQTAGDHSAIPRNITNAGDTTHQTASSSGIYSSAVAPNGEISYPVDQHLSAAQSNFGTDDNISDMITTNYANGMLYNTNHNGYGFPAFPTVPNFGSDFRITDDIFANYYAAADDVSRLNCVSGTTYPSLPTANNPIEMHTHPLNPLPQHSSLAKLPSVFSNAESLAYFPNVTSADTTTAKRGRKTKGAGSKKFRQCGANSSQAFEPALPIADEDGFEPHQSNVAFGDRNGTEGTASLCTGISHAMDNSSEKDESKKDSEVKKDPFSPECSIPLPFELAAVVGGAGMGSPDGLDMGLPTNGVNSLFPSGGLPSIFKRNERERHRVRCVNDGYERLRQHLPLSDAYKDKRLSKVETLRLAIRYIYHMQMLLADDRHWETCSCKLTPKRSEVTSMRGKNCRQKEGLNNFDSDDSY